MSTSNTDPPQLTPQAQKRLLHELSTLSSSPPPRDALHHLAPSSDASLARWTAAFPGPEGTPYAGYVYSVAVALPANYPLAPPGVRFLASAPAGVSQDAAQDATAAATKHGGIPVHPNVRLASGDICLDLLTSAAWSPAWTVASTVGAVRDLLAQAGEGVDSPLNVDAACLVRNGDAVGFEGLVRLFAERAGGER